MNTSDIFIAVVAVVLSLLPMFLLGAAGGFWCRRIYISAIAGLSIGILAMIVPLLYQSRDPMVLWGEAVIRLFLPLVMPAVLGSLVGSWRSPQRWQAGLTLVLCILGGIGYMILVPLWYPARAIARQTMCTNNLKEIGGALSSYAQAHDGYLPMESGAKGLDHLLSENFLNQTNNKHMLQCPWDTIRHSARPVEPLTEDTVSYVYAGGGTWKSEVHTNVVPICWDKIENHRNVGVNVLFNDGHVQWLRLVQWNQIKPKN
jgi:prepilin-type processing-associated H-X9-DG protein